MESSPEGSSKVPPEQLRTRAERGIGRLIDSIRTLRNTINHGLFYNSFVNRRLSWYDALISDPKTFAQSSPQEQQEDRDILRINRDHVAAEFGLPIRYTATREDFKKHPDERVKFS